MNGLNTKRFPQTQQNFENIAPQMVDPKIMVHEIVDKGNVNNL